MGADDQIEAELLQDAENAYEQQYASQTARAPRCTHARGTKLITPTLRECVDCHAVMPY